jgi:hypothetical protein
VKTTREPSSSSSSYESDTSSDEEIKKKKGRNKGAKQSYNAMSFNYNSFPSNNAFMFVPIGKAPRFNGMNYTQWHQSYDWREYNFSSFEKNDSPSDSITFEDNSQGKVIDYGKIAITTEYSISKVLLIELLDYNLLFISQLCSMNYNYLFTNKGVTIFRRNDGSFAFKGVLRGKFYLVDFSSDELELETCLIEKKTNMRWLWHRRLAHVDMRNLSKL